MAKRRGRPKGSTNHKTEVRRAREFQKWLGRLIELHFSESRNPSRKLTIDLSTGEVVKPARRKRRKLVKRVTRKPRKVKRARKPRLVKETPVPAAA